MFTDEPSFIILADFRVFWGWSALPKNRSGEEKGVRWVYIQLGFVRKAARIGSCARNVKERTTEKRSNQKGILNGPHKQSVKSENRHLHRVEQKRNDSIQPKVDLTILWGKM